jgi:hypothetical protein
MILENSLVPTARIPNAQKPEPNIEIEKARRIKYSFS